MNLRGFRVREEQLARKDHLDREDLRWVNVPPEYIRRTSLSSHCVSWPVKIGHFREIGLDRIPGSCRAAHQIRCSKPERKKSNLDRGQVLSSYQSGTVLHSGRLNNVRVTSKGQSQTLGLRQRKCCCHLVVFEKSLQFSQDSFLKTEQDSNLLNFL